MVLLSNEKILSMKISRDSRRLYYQSNNLALYLSEILDTVISQLLSWENVRVLLYLYYPQVLKIASKNAEIWVTAVKMCVSKIRAAFTALTLQGLSTCTKTLTVSSRSAKAKV